MTTQMNFGPQWMRGGDASKQYSFDGIKDNAFTESETTLNNGESNHSFKYSKEYMLSLYDKSLEQPVNIQQNEFVFVSQGQSPVSLLENENKTLAENSMSDNRFQQHTKRGGSKDSFKNFGSDDLRRGSEDDIPLWNGVDKDNVGTFDSNGVFRLGEASSSLLEGSLEPEGEKLEQDEFSFNTKDNYLFSSTAVLPDSNGTNKSLDHRRAMSHPSSFFFKNVSNVTNSNRNDVDTFQWVYRDPSGNTQGPFSSLEMHNWFEAGYFDPALSVKREDSSFFESIAELIRKVKDPKAPFLATWPESHCTSMNNNKNSFSIDLFGSEGSTTSGGSSLFGNTPFIDRIPHQNNQDSSLLFNSNVNSSATKAPFGGGNLPPPLSHVNPIAHDLRTPLSPWERPLSNNSNGLSWLNSQNDPILNAERAPQASFNNRQQQEAMHPSSGYDYQQQQQMEQRYLHMLRQNQQQHIQLQQRMLLQQQHQQQFMMQQQQQHDMFIHTQQANAMSRGWSSVPGTPGAIEPNIQSLWGNHITNEVDKSTGMSSPLRSRSPPVVSMRKTEVEENRLNSVSDQLSEKLSTMYVEDTSQKEDQQKASQDAVPLKKTLREIQSEQEAAQKNRDSNPSRSNTWSSVSAIHVPLKPASISPPYSANIKQSSCANAWDKPTTVRPKRMSMTAATPSTSVSTPRSSVSRHPTIKSEPRGPSEEFIKWCKLSLRGLNPGVNADEILQMLLDFPVDDSCAEIIQDMIYANSTSMDGRRFASDFMTRRKADMDGKKLNLVLPKSTAIISSEFKVVTKKGKKKPSSTAK